VIIAEIAQNFGTDLKLAQKLIHLAKDNGADLVKAQLYDGGLLFEDAKFLFDSAEDCGIEMFFSVFNTERVDWCKEIGVGIYKVAYSQRQNVELINYIITHAGGAGIFISTDRPIHPNWDAHYLYCVPRYPAKLTDISFEHLGSYAGFSDHTIGLDASKIALARGAKIIEKHFAIDHTTGTDAPWSMTPAELKELKEWENICEEIGIR